MSDLDKIIKEMQKLSVAIAVMDERLKNHLEKTEIVVKDVETHAIKLEETSDQVKKHQFFFKAIAYVVSLIVSGVSIKEYFHF